MLKRYSSKDDVINTGTDITNAICQDDRMNACIKSSYREAMKKLDTLSFDEMKEIIGILSSYDEDDEPPKTIKEQSDAFDDGTSDYEEGVICYKNKEFGKAVTLFQISARAGNPKALHGYGLCLYYGLGTNVDKLKAIKQFAMASEMGLKEADTMINYILKKQSS